MSQEFMPAQRNVYVEELIQTTDEKVSFIFVNDDGCLSVYGNIDIDLETQHHEQEKSNKEQIKKALSSIINNLNKILDAMDDNIDYFHKEVE